MEYTVIRSRRATISIQITPQGEVLVRCPLRMAAREIRLFVEKKAAWIEKHRPQRPPLPPFTREELAVLVRQAKSRLPQRVTDWANTMGLTCGRITIRAQHTRWGSCSSKGNLNFNCLLARVPEDVLDYVVVHELCHRKELNHSDRFWKEVERVLPEYRTQRKWLKENGASLIGRL